MHPELELGRNLAQVPVRIWHGEADGAVPVSEARRMQAELRDPVHRSWPRFECCTEGQTVRVVSEGTPGLTLEAGEHGLGLAGQVEVFWNGERAYAGPAGTITLGSGAD